MEVAGRELEMVVDTGATVTVIPTTVYRSVLSHVPLQSSTVQLQSYCGKQLPVKGEATVPVRYLDQEFTEKFVVVDVKNKPPVLGRSWLLHIKLDWPSLFTVQEHN